MLLITLVRASIRWNAVKMLRPLDAGIESQRCEAWFAIRAAYPNVRTGRLEAVIREGALATFRRLATIRRCRECNRPMCDEDRGQWVASMCAGCEIASVTDAVAKLNAPANDTTPAPLCSYKHGFPCGMSAPDCERCAPREGSWLAVRASQ